MTSLVTDRRGAPVAQGPWLGNCRVFSGSNLTLSGLQTIDGTALASGDRVLVGGQTDAVENGVYVARTGAWTRATDFRSGLEVKAQRLVQVDEGTAYGDTTWRISSTLPVTLDEDDIDFTQSSFGYDTPTAIITTDRTLSAADNGYTFIINSTNPVTITVSATLAAGFTAQFIRDNTGSVTFAAASGATVNNAYSHTTIAVRYGVAFILVRSNSGGSAAVAYLAGDTA